MYWARIECPSFNICDPPIEGGRVVAAFAELYRRVYVRNKRNLVRASYPNSRVCLLALGGVQEVPLAAGLS